MAFLIFSVQLALLACHVLSNNMSFPLPIYITNKQVAGKLINIICFSIASYSHRRELINQSFVLCSLVISNLFNYTLQGLYIYSRLTHIHEKIASIAFRFHPFLSFQLKIQQSEHQGWNLVTFERLRLSFAIHMQ